jgi:hypothetical protein
MTRFDAHSSVATLEQSIQLHSTQSAAQRAIGQPAYAGWITQAPQT